MKSILLVEDDLHLADGLVLNLEAEGYQVVHVSHGNLVLEEFHHGMFDLILLDIMLPGKDGITICKQLRANGVTVPVLFLTARDESDQKVEGLLAGGDDYITKPFEMAELLARLQSIFRRQAWLATRNTSKVVFEFDNRKINFETFEASGPGGTIQLSNKECMVLKYLIEREGEVISRDQLLDAIWGYQSYPTNRTVDNFIVHLRKLFEDDPKNPKYIHTIRGVGYRFTRSPSE